MPYWSMPEERRNEIWDDTIHFTAKGYDLFGTLVANRITEIMNSDGSSEEKGVRHDEWRSEI